MAGEVVSRLDRWHLAAGGTSIGPKCLFEDPICLERVLVSRGRQQVVRVDLTESAMEATLHHDGDELGSNQRNDPCPYRR